MGDLVTRKRAVTSGALLDEFATAMDAKCEISVLEIDREGCTIQIQTTNVMGVGNPLTVRRADAPSGPHVLALPISFDGPIANGTLRMTCVADPDVSGPFTVTYAFRWLV